MTGNTRQDYVRAHSHMGFTPWDCWDLIGIPDRARREASKIDGMQGLCNFLGSLHRRLEWSTR